MWFQDFANSLQLELQLPNKPLPRQKPTAETFSDMYSHPCPYLNSQDWILGYKYLHDTTNLLFVL